MIIMKLIAKLITKHPRYAFAITVNRLSKYYDKFYKQLFFGTILRLLLEGYLEFCLTSIINLKMVIFVLTHLDGL